MISGLAFLFTFLAAFAIGDVRSPQLANAVLVIVVTGFLVSTRAGIWMAFATTLSLFGFVYGRELGIVPEPFIEVSPYTTWATLTMIIAMSAVFLHVFVGAVTVARHDAAEKSARLEKEMQRREVAEASLRRAEKLEALGRLTGGIAHDFNNILTVLLAQSEILEANASPDRALSEEAFEQIAEIRRSTERAAALTSHLLSFSRQRGGMLTVVDLNAALERLEPMLQRLIREEIEFEIRPLTDVGAVRIDAVQLDQVMMNLVLNARDAIPGRGQISVYTEVANLDEA